MNRLVGARPAAQVLMMCASMALSCAPHGLAKEVSPALLGAGGPVNAAPTAPCPSEMVPIAQRFCIDRYEAAMEEVHRAQLFSPYYPANPAELRRAVTGQTWGPAALGKETLKPEVPRLPEWELSSETRARAVSRAGVTPQGYLSKVSAAAACQAAGKRLCSLAEWVTACRGEQDRPFPYGTSYRAGVCNVRSRLHPAAILYGDPSIGHWDPRLNFMPVEGAPLLKASGATPACKSAWGDDGVYDMVGNVDEWVQDGKGTFAGGFYARNTTRGCDARVSEHGPNYFDYSTGVRCCADLAR